MLVYLTSWAIHFSSIQRPMISALKRALCTHIMFLLFKKSINARLMSDIIIVNNLVEVYSDGTKAVDDISFSVPTIVNRNEVRDVLKLPLTDGEIAKLQSSASVLKNMAKSLIL